MKHQKILNLLNETNDSKFVTRKWNIVNYNSKVNYGVGSEIICNTEVLKSNLCDYNNAYILLRGNATIVGRNLAQAALENCAPFTKCITKIDETATDDAEDLDLVMPMYNLINIVQIILKQHEVYGFILKMNQLILMLCQLLYH